MSEVVHFDREFGIKPRILTELPIAANWHGASIVRHFQLN